MKVGDLVTWRKDAGLGWHRFHRFGLVINAEMHGHLGEQRLWLVVKWYNGETERAPEWLLASRVKVISESR